MPKTTKIVEKFPPKTTEAQIKKEQQLRMKAGAVSSTYEGSEAEGWTLTTIRKVIG
ncbi:MAG: hypothetical protein IH901_01820 [Proteobacteria bacterium]|nr:hypothetical protein [Pseudomonadota bacterium]